MCKVNNGIFVFYKGFLIAMKSQYKINFTCKVVNQDMVIVTKTCCCLQVTIPVNTCVDLFMLNRTNGEFFIFKAFVVLRYP